MSDHIPDVTKMISDTPRTDMMEKHAPVGLRRNSAFEQASGLCRQLERELNAANDRIKRLEDELNELRSDEAKLLNLNGELERRIKLILEAGDKMFPWSERVGQEFWTKAKEAKP